MIRIYFLINIFENKNDIFYFFFENIFFFFLLRKINLLFNQLKYYFLPKQKIISLQEA
jgi:hypothetical protein